MTKRLGASTHTHTYVCMCVFVYTHTHIYIHTHTCPTLVQTVKNPHEVWETWVPSLGWEEPLEKGMATHSGILAWRIPWTEEPGGLWSTGSQRVGHD